MCICTCVSLKDMKRIDRSNVPGVVEHSKCKRSKLKGREERVESTLLVTVSGGTGNTNHCKDRRAASYSRWTETNKTVDSNQDRAGVTNSRPGVTVTGQEWERRREKKSNKGKEKEKQLNQIKCIRQEQGTDARSERIKDADCIAV